MRYSGGGVAQYYKEAMKWYTKAAEQGNAVAQNNLGFMYDNGKGVAQDYKEAVNWWMVITMNGNFVLRFKNCLAKKPSSRGVRIWIN